MDRKEEMMDEITTSELNRKLSDILERVAKGEGFWITRYGKRIAVFGPPDMAKLTVGTGLLERRRGTGEEKLRQESPAYTSEAGWIDPEKEKPKTWAQRQWTQSRRDALLRKKK